MEWDALTESAFRGILPGKGLPLEELLCWHALRLLYAQYSAGLISKEAAADQKQKVCREFLRLRDEHRRMLAAYAQYQEHMRLAGELRGEIVREARAGRQRFDLAARCIGVMTGDRLFTQHCGLDNNPAPHRSREGREGVLEEEGGGC